MPEGAQVGPPTLSIVIPAYNEATRLPDSLHSIRVWLAAQPWQAEVLVVDDGSTDKTSAIVTQQAKNWPALRLIPAEHQGKGAAVRLGMRNATGMYVAVADADLSMPIAELDKLLASARDVADVAIGSREAPGAHRYDEPWYRHLMGRVFNRLVQLAVLPGIQDTQCGFKCLRRAAALELSARQTVTGWGFDVELLCAARQRGYRIVEVPINWHYRPESHVRLARDTVSMVRDVLTIRANLERGIYTHAAAVSVDSPAVR